MIKNGTQLYGVKPEMVMCDGIVKDVFKSYSVLCVRTSIVGKKHSRRSLHPVGYAVDYRTKHIKGVNRIATIEAIVEDLKKSLPCCDIVFEDEGGEQEHIHVEFDPKNDPKFVSDKAIYRGTGAWPKG
jgi:hypothetical protein